MREEKRRMIPVWGPYSKKYMGISRIMRESQEDGARFDLIVHPAYANGAVPVPNVTVPSGWHPWKCDSDGKFYRCRFELLWKDQLYADVDFFEVDGETWGIRTEYHNETALAQNCLLNFYAAMEYPRSFEWKAVLPDKSDLWKGTAFEEYAPAGNRPWDHLSFDGMHRGEQMRADFTEGTALGETPYAKMCALEQFRMFGGTAGDRVSYRRILRHIYEKPVLMVRYATYGNEEDVVFDSNYGTLRFPASTAPDVVFYPLYGTGPDGDGTGEKQNVQSSFFLDMTAQGTCKNGIMIDCFAVMEEAEAGNAIFLMEKRNMIPQIEKDGERTKYRYHYGEPPLYLHILNRQVRSRNLYSGCLEDAPITRLTNPDPSYDNLTRSFTGSFREKHSDEGFYHINVAEAIFIPAGGSDVEYAYVSTKEETYSKERLEWIWDKRRKKSEELRLNPEGRKYSFSSGLMKNALFFNVVYPIFRHGEQIVHYTPGKRWDSVYTWDSGFIGLGLLEYSPERAEYVLDTYLSEEDNQDFAFLAHGSLVPTQFYLWHEILMRSDSGRREELKKYYPGLIRYYRFMSGRTEGSTMSRLKSGMLTVYDYFYNAGGMDDYPAQTAMHRQKLSAYVAPICSSAHFIRVAKIMQMTARYYGYAEDFGEIEKDIRKVTDALLTYAWDEESGYFGYVLHDRSGNAREIFRTPEGENYNKGIDGVTPLIAGIGTPEQQRRMLAHLKTEGELWSRCGISTVDQSASYYKNNGYWNGSVWFPYQYLVWKSMLDLGEADFAYSIADMALMVWKQEADFSYHTFEMIQIETGRGGWFHQFSGLSAPIAVWFHAYYRKGTVTAGYGTWIREQWFSPDCSEAQICYEIHEGRENVIIVVMDSAYSYAVEFDGCAGKDTLHEQPSAGEEGCELRPVRWAEHVRGALEIMLPAKRGEIRIRRR